MGSSKPLPRPFSHSISLRPPFVHRPQFTPTCLFPLHQRGTRSNNILIPQPEPIFGKFLDPPLGKRLISASTIDQTDRSVSCKIFCIFWTGAHQTSPQTPPPLNLASPLIRASLSNSLPNMCISSPTEGARSNAIFPQPQLPAWLHH